MSKTSATHRSRINSANRKAGRASEQLVRIALRQRGVQRIEKIEVGWGIVRDAKGKIVNAYPLEKVSGDFRGLLPGGRAVHVEAKGRSGKVLYSDLEAHQVAALDEVTRLGGLALLAWHDTATDNVHLFDWAEIKDQFKPRTSLPACLKR